MKNTIRIALPGYNAESDTNLDHFALYGDIDNILIKELERGSASIANAAHTTITHNLGYVPLVLAFAEISSGVWVQVLGDASDYNVHLEVTTTTLVMYNASGATITFKYFIFYDDIVSGSTPAITPSKNPFLRVARPGKSAYSTNPNDFIFHSDLNTFKIIKQGTTTFSLSSAGGVQEFTVAHGLSYTPLVEGFAKFASNGEVMLPNQEWVNTIDNSMRFNSVLADTTNIRFRFTNNTGVTKTAYVAYYCFEVPF